MKDEDKIKEEFYEMLEAKNEWQHFKAPSSK